MEASVKKELTELARKVRIGVIESTNAAKCGHPGGSLSIAEIITWLYFKEMRVDPKAPRDPDRDRFVLSKGHTAPALYAALALRGFFPWEELYTLRKLGTRLQGHPSMHALDCIDMSTGSLGQGVSTACGMALAAKLDHKDFRVYTVLGDGESEEGQVWEAAMFAAHYQLDNLCAVFDLNGLQIDGEVEKVMNIAPMADKLRAFGWAVCEINGHDFDEIGRAFETAKATKGRPTAILSHTVKGKGVSFMENKAAWHGKATNPEEYEKAMAELTAAREA